MILTASLKTCCLSPERIEHQPVITVEQMQALNLPVLSAKNLFLKDRKKRFWLICALPATKIDLTLLGMQLKAVDLRFTQTEALCERLYVEPGAVTLLSIIHDPEHFVTVIIDKALYTQERIGFHPLCNDATMILSTKDITITLKQWGGRYQEVAYD